MKKSIPQLPFDQWPIADQSDWIELFIEGDVLDDAGPTRHWAPATRKTNQKHYAQWIGWLALNNELDEHCEPWSRATKDKVRAYASDLMEGRSSRTVASALIGLKCVLIKMAPGEDWQWLRDLTNRLKVWAKPSKPELRAPIPVPEMFACILSNLDAVAARSANKARDRQRYRDLLIVALLIACPIRLRNMVMIEHGKHLSQANNGQWQLYFSAEETKTGQEARYIVPESLSPHIRFYLDKVRPGFAGAANTIILWMGSKKAPLAENTLYQNTMRRTKQIFGTAIYPHAFRKFAATFLAETSPGDALRARPLLGHRCGDTTEKYYIQACQIKASNKVSKALLELKSADISRSDTIPSPQTEEI